MRCLYQKGNTHFAKSTEKKEAIKIRTLFIFYLVSVITHTHTHKHTHTHMHAHTFPLPSALLYSTISICKQYWWGIEILLKGFFSRLHGRSTQMLGAMWFFWPSENRSSLISQFNWLWIPFAEPSCDLTHPQLPNSPRPISSPWILSQNSHLLQNSTSNILHKFHSRNTTCVSPWTGHSHRRFHLYSGMERNTCPLEKTKIRVIPLWDCSLRCYVTFLLGAGRGVVLRSQSQDPILLNIIESHNIAELLELS